MKKISPDRLTDLSVNGTATREQLAAANSQAVILHLDPNDIDPKTGIRDRIDLGDILGLADSIRQTGQDTPITVRRAAEGSKFDYEIVSGRRRLSAIKCLNRESAEPVCIKAVVAMLSDEDLVLAQVRENAMRQDYSFAERMKIVAEMNTAGIFGTRVSAALGIDKSTVSRMERMTPVIGAELLNAFGRAPKLGRGSFEKLEAALLEDLPGHGPARDQDLNHRRKMVAELVISNRHKYESDENRLLHLALKQLQSEWKPPAPPRHRMSVPGLSLTERDGYLNLGFRIAGDPASKELVRDELKKAEERIQRRLAKSNPERDRHV